MNRRSFLQLASAALASIPLLRHVVAQDAAIKPALGAAWGGLPDEEVPRPVVKVTGVWSGVGFESAVHECEVNESAYIELPSEIRGPRVVIGGMSADNPVRWNETHITSPPDIYRIYAPLRGFEKTGPWYYLKTVSYRDAKRSRFTIAVEYQDADLTCQLAPGEYERLKGETNVH